MRVIVGMVAGSVPAPRRPTAHPMPGVFPDGLASNGRRLPSRRYVWLKALGLRVDPSLVGTASHEQAWVRTAAASSFEGLVGSTRRVYGGVAVTAVPRQAGRAASRRDAARPEPRGVLRVSRLFSLCLVVPCHIDLSCCIGRD